MVEHVAEHQRRALEPGDAAQGREVGLDREVAVAEVPRRRLVARHRLHLEVHGQEVVAAVHLVHDLLEEVVAGDPLADQAALHVDHADHDGVDRAGGDVVAQGVEIEIAGHRGYPRYCCNALCGGGPVRGQAA